MRPPLLLRWFKDVTIRFEGPNGNNVDYHIAQKKDSRHLTIYKTRGNTPMKGLRVRLADVIALARRISPEKAVLLACKLQSVKLNPHRKLRGLFALVTDRELISTFRSSAWFMLRHLSQGVRSVCLSPVRNKGAFEVDETNTG